MKTALLLCAITTAAAAAPLQPEIKDKFKSIEYWFKTEDVLDLPKTTKAEDLEFEGLCLLYHRNGAKRPYLFGRAHNPFAVKLGELHKALRTGHVENLHIDIPFIQKRRELYHIFLPMYRWGFYTGLLPYPDFFVMSCPEIASHH